MRILVIDIGGSHVKLARSWRRTPVKFDSGPTLTPAAMMRGVRALTQTWRYEAVSIGFPGPVRGGRPFAEPHNLGRGWVRFNFARAFDVPVRLINDAAMQALGSYKGGRMLFLGLGTGLGSALVEGGRVIPLELAHLPYRNGRSYEEYLGTAGLKRLGRRKWAQHVAEVAALFRQAMICDYVVFGGGNAHKLRTLPPKTLRGSNELAIEGGVRLWSPRAATS